MHHAVEAGDVETILAVGPGAAREAARAGSHRQALAHFESVLPHVHRLAARERADRARRLRLGALQRASLPRGGRRRPRGGAAVRAARRPVALGRVPRARLAPPVHGRRDRRGGARARSAAVTIARADRRRAGARARLALRGRDPRDDRRARARAEPMLAPRATWRCASGRPDLAALALNYLGIARVELGDPAGCELLRESIDGGDRRAPVRVRRARLLQPRRAARARRPARRARVVRGTTGCGSRASAGSGRTPTTSRCTAASPDPPRPLGGRAGRAARARRGRRRPGDAASPTASRGWAACSPAAATPRPATCSPPRGSARAASGC